MKKLLALLLALVMLLSFTACASESDSGDDEEEDEEETLSETVADEKTREEKGEETKSEAAKTEEAKNEEVATREPETEEPKTEEPKTEEPKTEEPKTEEPKTEEENSPSMPDQTLQSILYFRNDDVDGRWNEESITVVPKELYVEDEKLYAICYVVNGYTTAATEINIEEIIIADKNNVIIAHSTFQAQNLSLPALSYDEHTFIFDASTLDSFYVDMSAVTLSAKFRCNH